MTDGRIPRRRWLRSVRVQGVVLAAILIALPVLIIGILGRADADRRMLVLNAVGESGDAVAAGMAPVLRGLRPADADTLRQALARFAAPSRSIKVLLRPTLGAPVFYLIATEPKLPPEQTAAERQQLLDLGVLPDLAQGCDARFVRGQNDSLLDNGAQVLTAVSSVSGVAGCWAIVIATSEQQVLGAVAAGPYWQRPDVRLALAIYLLMAVLIAAMFGGIWMDLLRFRRLALASPEKAGFARAADTPELARVAVAFDSMVDRLRRSAELLRQAAEDNAHALKGPIATIRMAIDPGPQEREDDRVAQTAQLAIAAALDRLDGLVQSARRLDTAAAALLAPALERVDLTALVRGFVAEQALMVGQAVTLEARVADGVNVVGQAELLETILEVLVDNAVGFSSEGGQVLIELAVHKDAAVLTVSDDGPGIAPERLDLVFERYYSDRPGGAAGQHFGIGLWLARQNALAMGGRISVANREPSGLCVTVTLPAAQAG